MHDQQIVRLVYLLAWLLLLGFGGRGAVRRLKANPRLAMKYALIWGAIIIGLVLFYYVMVRMHPEF